METGINFTTENFPDKDYLILAIATFSGGKDEIFDKNYIPKPDDLRNKTNPPLMIDNSDGLFDNINPELFKNHKGRKMNLSILTPEQKM